MNATAHIKSAQMEWGMHGDVQAELRVILTWNPDTYPHILGVLHTIAAKPIPVTIEDPETPGELHSRTVADQIVKKLTSAGLVPDHCYRIAIDIGVDRIPRIYYEVALLEPSELPSRNEVRAGCGLYGACPDSGAKVDPNP